MQYGLSETKSSLTSQNTHAFAPSSFLWNILSSFIAQLLGTVVWLQSQQSIPTRSDLVKPLELHAICSSLP